ncbi:unnamed protein product, partial [Mycena citricolor]
RAPAMGYLKAPRALLSLMDAGLTSVTGAQTIIGLLSSRRSVTRLILGHNELGDDGCVVLFTFLSSALGRKYQITEISVNANGIGNRGLLAVSEYLSGAGALRELFLQNNCFTHDPATFSAFAAAVNASNLELLSLTTNHGLSDSFLEVFLASLDAPRLGEIHLSAIGLTARAAPHLVAYLGSARCKLHTLKCNGNSLGYRGVRSIVRAIERHNFSIQSLELYSNNADGPVNDGDASEDEEEDDMVPAGLDAWKACESQIRRILLRNGHLKRETENDALRLLQYSRPLLLVSSHTRNNTSRVNDCSCDSEDQSPSSRQVETDGTGTSPIPSLPIELQQHILSFFAPSLSAAQRIRIYNYASSPSTLPRLGLCLPQLVATGGDFCIPDSAGTAAFGGGSIGGKYAGAQGSREQQRTAWLRLVECTAYDPRRAVVL